MELHRSDTTHPTRGEEGDGAEMRRVGMGQAEMCKDWWELLMCVDL